MEKMSNKEHIEIVIPPTLKNSEVKHRAGMKCCIGFFWV